MFCDDKYVFINSKESVSLSFIILARLLKQLLIIQLDLSFQKLPLGTNTFVDHKSSDVENQLAHTGVIAL